MSESGCALSRCVACEGTAREDERNRPVTFYRSRLIVTSYVGTQWRSDARGWCCFFLPGKLGAIAGRFGVIGSTTILNKVQPCFLDVCFTTHKRAAHFPWFPPSCVSLGKLRSNHSREFPYPPLPVLKRCLLPVAGTPFTC